MGRILDQAIDACQCLWQTASMTSTPVQISPRPTCGPVPAVACCAPLVGEPIAPQDAVGLATVLKAIADPARLRLLSLVAAHENGEACACDLTGPLGLAQPTVSHHLKTLVDAGLLARDKRGVWAYYSLVPGALDDVARVLTTTARG